MNRTLQNFAIIAVASVASWHTASAQIDNGNAFMKGTYLEVGISQCGTFGTSTPPPGTNYHANASSQLLGFVADSQQDGWGAGSPEFCGDYFVPGTPEEGWNLKMNGVVYSNHNVCGPAEIPGDITTFSNANGIVSAGWAGGINGLSITKNTYFPENALYFVTQVTLTNTTSSPISQVYYMRNVDPDNEQPWTYDFRTENTVVSQPSAGNSYTGLVKGVGLEYGCFLGLGTMDARAMVSHGGFSNRDPQLIFNGTNVYHAGTRVGDEAISLAFNLGTINPNETVCFSYAYILNEGQLASALQATVQPVFRANGTDVTGTGSYSSCMGTSVTLQIEGGDSYNWSWAPAAGLNTTTGNMVVASPTGTTTYTATGTSLCGTITQLITLNAVTNTLSAGVTTTGTCPSGSTGSASASPSGGLAPYQYLWNNAAASTTQTISGLPTGSYAVTVTDAAGCQTTGTGSVTVAVLNVTASIVTPISAPGGSNGMATGNASGGTAPYYYFWNTVPQLNEQTAFGLSAGTYTVTAIDQNGCQGSANITLGNPQAAISASITTTTLASGHQIACHGGNTGMADLTVTGGSAPYTYLWSNGATTQDLSGVGAGTYTVTITDAANTTATASITLTQPNTLSANGTASFFNGHNVQCNGGTNGSVTLNVTGGVTPYSYNWSNGATTATATNLAAGSYSVTVTDANGCTRNQSFTLTQPAALSANAGADVTTYYGYAPSQCTALQGSASGGNGTLAYSWSNGATSAATTVCPTGPTTYTLTVTDAAGCQATDQVFVNAINITCGNGPNPKVLVCVNTQHNPHNVCVSVNAVPALLANGGYLGSCSGNSRTMADAAPGLELNAWPNPFSSSVSISLKLTEKSNAQIAVYDMNGRLVKQLYTGQLSSDNAHQFEFSGEKLPSGIYTCRVITDSETANLKLVLVQ